MIETRKGRYLVIEVKGQGKKIDYEANKKSYDGKIKSLFNEVFSKEVGFKDFIDLNKNFDYKIIFDAKLQSQQQELLRLLRNYSSN
ncbi:MAG: hypothetical protein GY817_01780 [bacterium]|nr:hypothetical protein [bacterium]